MAFRSLTRGLFQLVTHRRVCSTIFNRTALMPRAIVAMPMRSFASMQNNDDAYGDLSRFLDKEIQLEKSAQKHPSKLPTISGFEVRYDRSFDPIDRLVHFRCKPKVPK